MKKTVLFILIPFVMSCTQKDEAIVQGSHVEVKKVNLVYPETQKGDVVDNYFGTEVPDPYRWLEDDNSEETRQWVIAQNKVSFGYLETIPFRDAVKERLTNMWNYPKQGAPFKRNNIYFYSFNTGLQNQSIIYKQNSLEEKGEVFLDPNKLSDDGTVALAAFSISPDEKYVAYGISRAGSDWMEYFVKDVETGTDLDDHLEWIKSSGAAWLNDGFFYSRFDTPTEGDVLKGENINSKVFFHTAGTLQSEDLLIYADPEHPERTFSVDASDDQKILTIYAYESTSGNACGFRKVEDENKEFTWLLETFDNNFFTIGNKDNILYIMTDLGAPMYRLIAVDIDNPEPENWIDIIPEKEGEVLESCSLVGGSLIATYLKDAHNVSIVFDLEGNRLHEVDLPGIGSVGGFGGNLEDEFTFYTFTSFNYPPAIFKYTIAENRSELYHKTELDFDGEDYETKQVFYTSKDGTKVPMFIIFKKGVELDGTNPTILYGYGGFNISYTPTFSIMRAAWLEKGCIWALANLRGGGEYGEAWHKAGTILNKQNVFDDFIAAAEYLIDNDYTSPEKLGIFGGSNGGLLVGAVTNQRPDLFAAAIPAVGVMDMLRFQKFTIGRYWTTDYGSSDDPEQFEYIYRYSPLHNISTDKEYPAVMATSADHDDRVVPAHSFKYIATLQDKYTGERPVIIRIETDAGHSAGKPTDKAIEEAADELSFFWYNMGFEPTY